MLLSAAFIVLEPALNKAMSYDRNAQQKLAKLENRKLSVILTDLSISVSLLVINGQIKLMTNTEASDCTVKTSLDKLKSLSDASTLTKLIKADELELDGDLHIAQAYSNVLLENDIDWSEWLAQYVGDAMAHRIATVLNNLKVFIQRKSADFDYTVSTALTDELKVTPDQIEVERFISDVDRISARTERLLSECAKLRNSI